jgi:hypothetical protein
MILVVLGAIPSQAVSPTNKLFSIDVTGPAATSTSTTSYALAGASQTFKVKLTNQTPGSSNFQSAIISTPLCAPSPGCGSTQNFYVTNGSVNRAESNNGNQNGANPSAIVSWLNSSNQLQCTKPASVSSCPVISNPQQGKVYAQYLDPVKSANNLHQYITFNVTMTTPAVAGCGSATATPQWNAVPINGTSLSGDTFAIQGPNSGRTTEISGQCGSVTITKYNDANVNDTKDSGEALLTDGWEFKVYDASDQLVGTQTTDNTGSVTFSLPTGQTYKVCESDSKIDPNSDGWADHPWSSTDADGCKSVTPSTSSGSTLNFGNAIGNLTCGGSISDGPATVKRLDNTDGEVPCILKPASVDYSKDGTDQNVTFLVAGTQHAAYKVTINWDPIDNTNPPVTNATTIDLPGGTHPLEWCVPDGVDQNSEPDLPSGGEVGCIISQTWNIFDATRVQETEVIYLEADIVLSKKT